MGPFVAVKIPLRSDLRGLVDFVAYYRNQHSITTLAERVIPGNIKKLFAEELNYIVEKGELSEGFKGLIKDYQVNRARVIATGHTSQSKLEAAKLIEKELSEEERRELLSVLLNAKP
jgi:lipase chaperone LimK